MTDDGDATRTTHATRNAWCERLWHYAQLDPTLAYPSGARAAVDLKAQWDYVHSIPMLRNGASHAPTAAPGACGGGGGGGGGSGTRRLLVGVGRNSTVPRRSRAELDGDASELGGGREC